MAKGKNRPHGRILETMTLAADEKKRIDVEIPAEFTRDGKPVSFPLTVINETGDRRSFDIAVNRDPSVEAGFTIALIIRKPTNGEIKALEDGEDRAEPVPQHAAT